MKPFLRLIAEAYIANERDTLSDTCFVFPTKRAGQFFLHYLGHEAASGQFMIMPEVITMGAFCSRFTRRTVRALQRIQRVIVRNSRF